MIYKRGSRWWFRFWISGVEVRESTKQKSDKEARRIEAKRKASLLTQLDELKAARTRLGCIEPVLCFDCQNFFDGENGTEEGGHKFCSLLCRKNWIAKHRVFPTVAEFLKNDFLPYVQTACAAKLKTVEYYTTGVRLLSGTNIGGVPVDQVTSQHTAAFVATLARFSASTANTGLRTLRRALNLAEEWGTIDRAPKIKLAPGERQRERIVAEAEFVAYLELCRQPWRDAVTVLWGTAMRPGELYKLRWEDVAMDATSGMLQVTEGKSRAARRMLPMVPDVVAVLLARWHDQKKPSEGWVFGTGSASGHLEQGSGKNQHDWALAKLALATAAYKEWLKLANGDDLAWYVAQKADLSTDFVSRHLAVIKAGIASFPPYSIRHTALTRLAQSGCDVFTLAKIAGHSSIGITQRYVHPEQENVKTAFARLTGKRADLQEGRHEIGTKTPKRKFAPLQGTLQLAENQPQIIDN
jgi:integrase